MTEEDFYIENGYQVFTESFLAKRGYCCDSGCRHCPYTFNGDKKLISLVPSWTETLIEAGILVLGRTRYCIHPKNKISDIDILGGTKKVDYKKVNTIEADYVLLDKHENPKEFAKEIKMNPLVTEVTSLESLKDEFIALNKTLKNKVLNQNIIDLEVLMAKKFKLKKIEDLPGVIQWINPPKKQIKKVVYLIWKDPWMTVSKNTFIASMLSYVGVGDFLQDFDNDYPEIDLDDFDKDTTLLLFSSEPYPFEKKLQEIKDLNFPSALVDGESYSWFGVRAINFLKSLY